MDEPKKRWPRDEEARAFWRAKEFLEAALATGPVDSWVLRARAESEGHLWKDVRKARKRLGIWAVKKCLWKFPPDDPPAAPLEHEHTDEQAAGPPRAAS